MNKILTIFIGGGIGSVFRYAISVFILKFYNNVFPLATFISNILACILMSIFIYFIKNNFQNNEIISLFLLTGICGGFSTFSTFSYENFILFNQGYFIILLLNIILSLLVGFVFIFLILK